MSEIHTLTLDLEVYSIELAKCVTPKIIGFATEGSNFILVGASGADGIEVRLNTGEVGTIENGVCYIELIEPLAFGDEVWAEIVTDNCNTRSCSVYASRIANYCIESAYNRPAGQLNGRLVCVESDFYRQVYDGDGGVYAGVLAQEDCIYCGGVLPNCIEEPPSEITTFYNIVSCSNGLTYQTETVLSTLNQRVSDSSGNNYYYNGTTQTSAVAYVGAVSLVGSETGCPTIDRSCKTYTLTGLVGGGTYSYVDCSDGITYGPYSLPQGLQTTRCCRAISYYNCSQSIGSNCGTY